MSTMPSAVILAYVSEVLKPLATAARSTRLPVGIGALADELLPLTDVPVPGPGVR